MELGDFGITSTIPDIGGTAFNWIPDLGGGGGGGGFNWGSLRDWIGPSLDIGKFGLSAGLGIMSQQANAKYQRQLQDYYKQRSAQEAAYNAAILDYQKQRQAWEQEMFGQFGEVFGTLGEQIGQFQDTIGGILQQQINAATPLLAQSQELLQPAVAALARGEVPALFQPILDQAKQRARAAAAQQYESAGIDSGTALASIEPQIDQQAQQMLLAAATQMLTGGLNLSQTGTGTLTQAAGTAQAGMSPILAEFQAMMSALNNLFGGMGSLAGGTAPPPPVA